MTKQNGSSPLRPSPQTTNQNLVSRRYGPSWTHDCKYHLKPHPYYYTVHECFRVQQTRKVSTTHVSTCGDQPYVSPSTHTHSKEQKMCLRRTVGLEQVSNLL